jgi:hypothetical protein
MGFACSFYFFNRYAGKANPKTAADAAVDPEPAFGKAVRGKSRG